MKHRISTFLTIFAVIWCATAQAGAVFKGLPMAVDLRSDAVLARNSGRTIMVFFATEYCGYCEIVSELYLRPMQQSGSHEDRILLRVVQTDNEAARLIGFDGKRTDHYNFASRNAASMTPTIKFYGPDGQELVPEIFGYSSPDYWGLYLEQSINQAVSLLRSQHGKQV